METLVCENVSMPLEALNLYHAGKLTMSATLMYPSWI
jgi:hypothetical protein